MKKKKSKKEKLLQFAKESSLVIDHEETLRISNLISDVSVTFRVPKELKEKIQAIAKEKRIPYQRLIKSYILQGLGSEKKDKVG